MRLSRGERKLYAEKVMDLGNLAVAALIFGQMVSKLPINPYLVLSGLVFYFVCLIASHLLQKE